MVDVIIVDDQAPFRSVARALIRLLPGWRVVGEAATGEDALDLVTGGKPTMILMDINLPGINGIEATRRILAESPDVKVVLVSTYAADDLPPDSRRVRSARLHPQGRPHPRAAARASRLSARRAACRPPMPCTPGPGGVAAEQM